MDQYEEAPFLGKLENVTENFPPYQTPKNRPLKRNQTLRILAILIFVLWVIDVGAGSSWEFGYSLGIAAIHVSVAVLMVGVTALALVISPVTGEAPSIRCGTYICVHLRCDDCWTGLCFWWQEQCRR